MSNNLSSCLNDTLMDSSLKVNRSRPLKADLKICASMACYAFLLLWEKFHETVTVFCAYICAWGENWRFLLAMAADKS